MASFETALKELLKHEGGFVNHPKDPGGITNLGVTLRTWQRWVGRPVGEREMRELTPSKVAPLYKKRYWDKVHAYEMPYGLGLQVFDFGVNAGPRRAIRLLQKSVGTLRDGLYGPMTRRAVTNYIERHGVAKLIERYAANRLKYYRSLRNFRYFGRGWTRRTNEVMYSGLRWVKENNETS